MSKPGCNIVSGTSKKEEGVGTFDLAAFGVIGGMILTQAFTWNPEESGQAVRTCRYDAKRKL